MATKCLSCYTKFSLLFTTTQQTNQCGSTSSYSDLIKLNRVHQLLCIEKFTLLPHEHLSFSISSRGERIAYNHISNQNMSLSLLLLWCRLLLRRHRVSKGSSNGNGRSNDSVAFHRLNKDDGRNHNDDNTLGSVENRYVTAPTLEVKANANSL